MPTDTLPAKPLADMFVGKFAAIDSVEESKKSPFSCRRKEGRSKMEMFMILSIQLKKIWPL